MNVKQLIEKLKNISEDTKVIVNGYEGGYNIANNIEMIDIQFNKNAELSYEGQYCKHYDSDKIKAVLIR